MSFRTAALVLFTGMALMACSKQDAPATDTASSAPTTSEAPAPTAPTSTDTAAPAAPSTPPATEEASIGKSVYGKTCAMCHAAGVAGAPKPGDKVDWGPRIAQGNDLLYKHALEGFTGAKGMMPARGGSATLTDDEVKAAVDYMVAQSR